LAGWIAVLLVGLALAPAASLAARAPSHRTAHAAACTQEVSFQLVDATTTGCLDEVSTGEWKSSDTVKLNGVPLIPAPGTQMVLDAPSDAAPGGKLSVSASITVAGVTFEKQRALSFNLPAGGKGDEKTIVTSPTLNGQKLFGFDISGSAEIRIGWDATTNLKYVKFIGNLALPSVFKNGPEQGAGGLTATVGLKVDNAGVHADAVKAEVTNAYIGPLQVKHLCLSYLAAGSTSATPCSPPLHGDKPFIECQSPGNVSRWDGTAEIVLPTAARPEVGVYAGVQNNQFSYAGGQVTNLGTSVPLATGVFLDNVKLGVCVTPPPFKLKGAAGINAGGAAGKALVTINGSLEFTNSRPWVLEVAGSLDVVGKRVASGFIKYQSNNTIDFGLNVNFDLKVASLQGGVNGWIEARNPLRFNVDGNGKVCILGKACVSGEVTVSSTGIAGCFKFLFWRVGVGYRWGGSASVMGKSCDVGPYRASRGARDAAAGVYRLPVAPNTPALSFQAKGLGGPPGVELIAPNGAHFTSPAAPVQIVPNREIFVKNPLDGTTSVMLAKPVPGAWIVRALPGSTITSVSQATITPPPSFNARVTGTGYKRVLSYSYRAEPLHSIRFVEVGAKYEQELGPASGRACRGSLPLCGHLGFTPAAGPAGLRHIYAITTMNGEIVHKQLVASYSAPPEPEPSIVPSLKVQRIGTTVRVIWGGSKAPESAARAVDYNIDINLSDGRRLLDVASASSRTVTIPGVDPGTAVQVSLSPMRVDDTQGKTRTVSLPSGATGASARPGASERRRGRR
jgi:hypothetical protein